jgi:UDP-N-acetyl-D-mannosaminuronic acid dehydrogenase
MPLSLTDGQVSSWSIRKIVVIGPGIVGVPMAALLAHQRIREGNSAPARVVVLQRPSVSSGWKVDAINAGRSPIGGIEPALDTIIADAVAAGTLSASHDYTVVTDADVILVCVQTDREGLAPAYGPLFEALTGLADALQNKSEGLVPLIIFESTLAPTSMSTVIRDHFARYGLLDGRDLLLGNSPNRVMPGRLLERVATSDKLAAGLQPVTPDLIARLYSRIVTQGRVHRTNSLTAEVVKTLENAYRDVRIAYASEVARHCDAHDLDYYHLREEVNARLAQSDEASHDPNAVPSGGLLVPSVGVGGHCLPKDGILLWWRALESGIDSSRSLILEARSINDESPAETLRLIERNHGPVKGRAIALLGAAYRFNSEDTRNSPALALARLLEQHGARVTIHDPYVQPDDQNLRRTALAERFTNDLAAAVAEAEVIVFCAAHRDYFELTPILSRAPRVAGVVDACNLLPRPEDRPAVAYSGIGRGRSAPSEALTEAVLAGFRTVERGVANELDLLIRFLNRSYAATPFEQVSFSEVQRLAATCGTGCRIVDPGPVEPVPQVEGFVSRLVSRAMDD